MFKIRKGLFETNSSSIHSLSILSKKDYEKWKNGELYFDEFSLLTKDEVIEEIKKDKYAEVSVDELLKMSKYDFDEEVCKEEYYTFDEWKKCYYSNGFETFKEEYTTESGDEIVVFGYYGTSY